MLVPDVEFTSLLFPFLVQEHRGVTVRLVPAAELVAEIGPDVDVVAFSAVQMASGEVADLDGVAAAAAEHGALTVVDATQAVGWLPFAGTRFDVVVAHAYKWMMSPRGTAFMAIRPERMDAVVPHAAGWYAGEDPLQTFFGGPLRLAASARRLDTSPAWFMWVATAASLDGDRADRRRRDPRARRRTREPVPCRVSGSSRATPRSCSATPRDAADKLEPRRASGRRSEEDGCAPRGTSTTRRPTSIGRSTCF